MLFHIWSKKDQVLSIKPSANVLVFGDFNNHHKEWMTYSSGTDRPGELCSNFCTSNGLTQIVRFPTGSLTITITVLLFWIYFILLMVVFALQWRFVHWEILIMLLSQFPLTFCQTQNGMPFFIEYFTTIFVLLGRSSWSFERCSMGR